MDGRYQDPDVLAVLNKASFLDPRFKSLVHLSPYTQQETHDELLAVIENSCLSSATNINDVPQELNSPAKKKN